MTLPPTPDSSRPSSSSELPADYRNPWLSLGENLQAVVADVRLRLRQLWRRNGEGSLWRPIWWPRDLAPLFWPLVLILLLSLLLLFGFGGAKLLREQQPQQAAPVESMAEPFSEATPTSQDLLQSTDAEDQTVPEHTDQEPELVEPPATVNDQETSESPPASTVSSPAPLDPLSELLGRPEAQGLLIGAERLPDQGTLLLQVSSAFASLPLSSQQRHAERWQRWAQDLGYDHLELRDSRSGLLARDALVGTGMIILNQPSLP